MPSLISNGDVLASSVAGSGRPLLMIHGSLCDYRYWAPQMSAFATNHRAIAVSLRRCWPERWDGAGDGYSIEAHVEDLISFVESLDAGEIDLIGHSRGGLVAFRMAQQQPRLVRRLVLAEPGVMPDASFIEAANLDREQTEAWTRAAASRIAAGDIEGGVQLFIDGVSGTDIWKRTVPGFKRMALDNAHTLLGQAREHRKDITRAELEALRTPTLLIGGALSPKPFPQMLELLEHHLPDARRVMIPGARHAMNLSAPSVFNAAVLGFLS